MYRLIDGLSIDLLRFMPYKEVLDQGDHRVLPAGADSAIISVIAAKALPSTSRGVIVAQSVPFRNAEQCGGTTFIAVGEQVVLDNLIQQLSGFLLGGTVQFFASERLVESCDDSLPERHIPANSGLRVEDASTG